MATALCNCTIKPTPVPTGIIPEYDHIKPEERAYGARLFEELDKDHEIYTYHARYGDLLEAWTHLLEVIGADYTEWQLIVFNDPEIVDVRAVHGNYVFVWSGFLDLVEPPDEIAAILACEIAHVLADHTEPVKFTVLSRILFGAAEIVTSAGLIILSQGTVAVGGQGWMKYVYAEAADLDPLDREYSEEQEREAIDIACLLLGRSKYSPMALMSFWNRVQKVTFEQEREVRLNRSIPLKKRMVLMDAVLPALSPKVDRTQGEGQDYAKDFAHMAPPL